MKKPRTSAIVRGSEVCIQLLGAENATSAWLVVEESNPGMQFWRLRSYH